MINIISGEKSLSIEIISRQSNSDDYWDGNWLTTHISTSIPHCNVDFNANIRTDELKNLHKQLSSISEGKSTKLDFITMEEDLKLSGEMNVNGEIACECRLIFDVYSELKFVFSIFLGDVDRLVNSISRTLEIYPVVGTPE